MKPIAAELKSQTQFKQYRISMKATYNYEGHINIPMLYRLVKIYRLPNVFRNGIFLEYYTNLFYYLRASIKSNETIKP